MASGISTSRIAALRESFVWTSAYGWRVHQDRLHNPVNSFAALW
jgi:hypothetical protein